jgi:hypothetical protein
MAFDRLSKRRIVNGDGYSQGDPGSHHFDVIFANGIAQGLLESHPLHGLFGSGTAWLGKGSLRKSVLGVKKERLKLEKTKTSVEPKTLIGLDKERQIAYYNFFNKSNDFHESSDRWEAFDPQIYCNHRSLIAYS